MKFVKVMIYLTLVNPSLYSQQQDYNSKRWIIISADKSNPMVSQQVDMIKEEAEASMERRIAVGKWSHKEFTPLFNYPVDTSDIINLLKSKRFDSTEFEVVLLGLDTTIKLRQNKPIKTNKLFELIDSMPMRQREMRQQNKK